MLVEPQLFVSRLNEQLATLTPLQQLTFGALCCERHLPEYKRFSADQNWGDVHVLDQSIDLAWSFIRGDQTADPKALEGLLAQCIEATPDSDDFPSAVSDYAQDSAIMVCHLVQFIAEGKVSSIVHLASRARDLIDAKVQIEHKLEPSDPDLEVKIANAPEMVAEISSLKNDLKAVSTSNKPQELLQLRQSI